MLKPVADAFGLLGLLKKPSPAKSLGMELTVFDAMGQNLKDKEADVRKETKFGSVYTNCGNKHYGGTWICLRDASCPAQRPTNIVYNGTAEPAKHKWDICRSSPLSSFNDRETERPPHYTRTDYMQRACAVLRSALAIFSFPFSLAYSVDWFPNHRGPRLLKFTQSHQVILIKKKHPSYKILRLLPRQKRDIIKLSLVYVLKSVFFPPNHWKKIDANSIFSINHRSFSTDKEAKENAAYLKNLLYSKKEHRQNEMGMCCLL